MAFGNFADFNQAVLTADSASLVIPPSTLSYEPGKVRVYVNNTEVDTFTANRLSTDPNQRIVVTGLTAGDVVKARATWPRVDFLQTSTYPNVGDVMQVVTAGDSDTNPKMGFAPIASLVSIPYFFDGITTQYQNVNVPAGSYISGPNGSTFSGGGYGNGTSLTTGTVLSLDSDNAVRIDGANGQTVILSVPVGHSPGGTAY